MSRPARIWKILHGVVLAGLAGAVIGPTVWWASGEIRTSHWQASMLSRYAGSLSFEMAPGASDAIRYPENGPYDERFGYSRMPQMLDRLQSAGFEVTGQARMSPAMLELLGQGLFATYVEKNQAGLELKDCRAEPLFSARYPHRVYDGFTQVPALLVQSLLFIENRELLDPAHPNRNPAVEWDRFAKASADQLWRMVDSGHSAHGGSTLATQIEKYRHSPEGRTGSAREKLRQMASASVRAYLGGEDTMARRQQIVVDYLNTVPLAASPGFGEVNGVGDGLHAWYGRDFDEVNALIGEASANDAMAASPARRAERALAFKQALSLMVAQRRPAHYLLEGRSDLGALTDSHLRLLASAGVISEQLRDDALAVPLGGSASGVHPASRALLDRKASNAMRTRLASLLGVPRTYDLDRLDLSAWSTLDGRAQENATRLIRSLATPEGARNAGLYGFRLLDPRHDPSRITFSFTLYERGEQQNFLRIQTDSTDNPFDLNDGARLDLGSTSKLRTLVSYLEVIAKLHARWSALAPSELSKQPVAEQDQLAIWSRQYLAGSPDRSLQGMLDAAMQRTYSASPAEAFFTGGGLHRFGNFDSKDDGRTMDVTEALRHSVNLVFIRMMRDVVRFYMFNAENSTATILSDRSEPKRLQYLARFADQEGREFIRRFYRQYAAQSQSDAKERILRRAGKSPTRLASVFHGLEPESNPQELAEFLTSRGVSADSAESLHERYGPDTLSLQDRGYIAGVHPLELWVAGYLRHNPQATLAEVIAASADERQQVYQWLFKNRSKAAQDRRIREMLEVQAFGEIHASWKRLGYPFASLTPSYAASLGASGDRPSALAELMGILANDGVRQPTARIDSMVLAQATPYETHVGLRGARAERVIPMEVARTARQALFDVVEKGTARRLHGILKNPAGEMIAIGGKTGTGDHRNTTHGRNGEVLSSRVVSRTATFAFLIGDRYYGTIMAYVGAPHAQDYSFTSALPTQLLKAMGPALMRMLDDEHCGEGRGRSTFVTRWRENALPAAAALASAEAASEDSLLQTVGSSTNRPETIAGSGGS